MIFQVTPNVDPFVVPVHGLIGCIDQHTQVALLAATST